MTAAADKLPPCCALSYDRAVFSECCGCYAFCFFEEAYKVAGIFEAAGKGDVFYRIRCCEKQLRRVFYAVFVEKLERGHTEIFPEAAVALAFADAGGSGYLGQGYIFGVISVYK